MLCEGAKDLTVSPGESVSWLIILLKIQKGNLEFCVVHVFRANNWWKLSLENSSKKVSRNIIILWSKLLPPTSSSSLLFSFSIERTTPIIYYQDLDTYSYTRVVNSFWREVVNNSFWNNMKLFEWSASEWKETKDELLKKWLSLKIVISLMWSIWWNIIQWLCFVTGSVNRDENVRSWWSFKSSCLPLENKVLVHNWQQYFSEENILV